LAEGAVVAGVAVVAASAPAVVVVVVVVEAAAVVEAAVALERSNMPTRHISTPQSLNRSRLQ
jgi:hypothetical protein